LLTLSIQHIVLKGIRGSKDAAQAWVEPHPLFFKGVYWLS